MQKQSILSLLLSLSLAACASQSPNEQPYFSSHLSVNKIETTHQFSEKDPKITLEKIMSDPDWLGRQPEQPYWALDSQSVFYQRKQQGKSVRDLYQQSLQGDPKKVELNHYYHTEINHGIYSENQDYYAYEFSGDVYVRHIKTGQLQQLTRTSAIESQLLFVNQHQLAYRVDNTFFISDLIEQQHWEVANLKLANEPKKIVEPKGYLAQEQHQLINYIAKRQQNKKDQQQHQETISKNNPIVAKPWYLGEGKQLNSARLSPNGRWLLISMSAEDTVHSSQDIMPNYITDDAGIAAQPVRTKVSDRSFVNEKLWLLDLNTHEKALLSYEHLPNINQDVFKTIRAENELEAPEATSRAVNLIVDWHWQQKAIQWHPQGQQAAIMLETADNKDRWLVTVDVNTKKLVVQHHLHDPAWINYTFNQFGWLPNTDKLYFLSEESGFSHVYLKPIQGKAKALTAGAFEVSDLVVTRSGKWIYAKANHRHPGNYEVIRVDTDQMTWEEVTRMGGNNEFWLSPDENKLLLQHSKIATPPELYLFDLAEPKAATRLTHTISEAFLSYNWTIPEIVPIHSSYDKQPIYSRVFHPDPQQATGKAVMFAHGAGYTQAAHQGWSYYFREFMFHSLLTQQGYTVMNMDYRASKGYGRDWRTAIYRQMGKPEIEDLRDGVQWLAKNTVVDAKKVGVYGGSYGGFMTFMALFTDPDLFQAGAALRPVTDWAHYNHPYTSNILNTPEIDPIAYRRSSPIYFAEGLTKPLLILAPMVDDNVFFHDTVRLVQRLIELEKENFETAIYPVEPHGFKQPSSWLDEYRRIYKLFETQL